MAEPVQTTSEKIGKDRFKVRVEVSEDALKPAIEAAYKRWSSQIRVPGFRKGRVPRQLIDSHVGPGVVRQEAVDDALPTLMRDALRAEELIPIAPAEIESIDYAEGSPLVFEATVDVRPDIEIPDPSAIEVEAPSAEVTDADIDEQLDRLRDRFAELEPAARPLRRGDFALIDIKGYQHNEIVEGASAPDLLYEVGSGTGPPKLDSELEGNKAGAILKFTDEVHIHREDEAPDDHSHMAEISFTVLVKDVKVKKLPQLDDEFAKTVGEFDSLDELRDDLRDRLREVKQRIAEEELRSKVLAAVVDAADLQSPERLVEEEFQHRFGHFQDELKRAGVSLDEYGRQTQLTELEIRRDLRDQAARAVKAELLLEEVARVQEVEVEQEDLAKEIALLAARTGQDPKEVTDQLVGAGRLGTVAADVLRRKALDWLVANVKVIGLAPDGA
jgi:trigger factor